MPSLRKEKPPTAVGNFLAVLNDQGTNDTKRGEAVDLSKATVRKMLSGDVSQMIEWLSRHPVLCAALLVDALNNTASTITAELVQAVEHQLTTAGQSLENAADRHFFDQPPAASVPATPAIVAIPS